MDHHIKGITVILINRVESGRDPFNAPVYSEERIPIDNVLVAPITSSEDVSSMEQIYGKKAAYTLAIPKGDTHIWQDQAVEFFGERWQVFGFPQTGIEDNIPLEWNTKWTVARYG